MSSWEKASQYKYNAPGLKEAIPQLKFLFPYMSLVCVKLAKTNQLTSFKYLDLAL